MEESTEEKTQSELESMKESLRKLAIWYTKNFAPLRTHDELSPIMSTLGFVPSIVSLPIHTIDIDPRLQLRTIESISTEPWVEYLHCSSGLSSTADFQPPRPRLPYPRIDSLHIYTYRAFLDALNFYLCMPNLADLFHVRGLPLQEGHDRSTKWWFMGHVESIFLYREGTLGQATYDSYCDYGIRSMIASINDSSSSKVLNSMRIRNKGKSPPASCMVPLKDIIVSSSL